MQHAQTAYNASLDNVRELIDEDVASFVSAERLAAVEVYTQWCGFCRALAPHYAALADEYRGWIAFGKIDGDFNPRYVEDNEVQAYPTVHLYLDGERVSTALGFVRPPELRRILDELIDRA